MASADDNQNNTQTVFRQTQEEDQYALVPATNAPNPYEGYQESDMQNSMADRTNSIGNQQITLKNGYTDEAMPEFIAFKRQNITRWGGISYLI